MFTFQILGANRKEILKNICPFLINKKLYDECLKYKSHLYE